MKTSFSKAVQMLEEETKQPAAEIEHVKLNFTNPPIDKIDPAVLSTLVSCKHLSLSTNAIEKMVPISGMRNLEILSLGRNMIKKIYGLEEVGANLKELWISYNLIEKLDGIAPHCTALNVIYCAHNKIKDWGEIDKIKELPALTNVVFLGNDIYEKMANKEEGRMNVLRKINKLTMIDNILVTEADKLKLDEQ